MNEPVHLRGGIQWADTFADARRIAKRLHPSRKYQPLKMLQRHEVVPETFWEQWQNDLYDVTVRRYPKGNPFGSGLWIQLGICSEDGSARHDWRDFQAIKNQLCGEDWEGIELYPAEERLIDPSNYFIIYCYPKVPIGIFAPRMVRGVDTCLAPQRGWHPDNRPKDLS
jgi:hypothetical protein